MNLNGLVAGRVTLRRDHPAVQVVIHMVPEWAVRVRLQRFGKGRVRDALAMLLKQFQVIAEHGEARAPLALSSHDSTVAERRAHD